MSFQNRLAKIRRERNLGFPDLASLTGIHATQLRRYEKGESLPTLDALRKLAVVLNVPGDVLLFDEDERKPPDDFLMQFKALETFEAEDKITFRAVVEGLIMRCQARKLIKREAG